MNLETLQLFCEVVKQRSFSKAARAAGISQSAVTQAVHRVEEHFGVQLLDRSRRPFSVTAEGQVCFDGLRQMFELFEDLEARIRSVRMEIAGVVRVAAIYSVGLHDMSRCMQEFMRRYPKANVRLTFEHPQRVYEAVASAEVDLGVVSYPRRTQEIVVIPLRSEPMVLVCPPDHPLAERSAVTLEHLQGHKFVAFDPDLMIRKEIDRSLRQRAVSVQIAMEFDNIETIKQAVEIGAGVSILPEPTVRREVEAGSLKVVELIAPKLMRPIGIIHRRKKVFAPTAAKFIELLREMQPEHEASEDDSAGASEDSACPQNHAK
ncbi:MAG: LysR family transcriptional regulator [Planctomycetota bacterium]|nr:MAG: LysR family transcriptional regulator [Planctomycetota bacterium]